MSHSNRMQAFFTFFVFLAFQAGLFAVDPERQPPAAPVADEEARVDFIILWADSGKITIIDAVRGAVSASLTSDEAMRAVKGLPDNLRVLLCLPSSTGGEEARKLRVQIASANPTIRSVKVITPPRER